MMNQWNTTTALTLFAVLTLGGCVVTRHHVTEVQYEPDDAYTRRVEHGHCAYEIERARRLEAERRANAIERARLERGRALWERQEMQRREQQRLERERYQLEQQRAEQEQKRSERKQGPGDEDRAPARNGTRR